MIGRFSLYGFLKNQQYYDYVLVLAFRQMGLSFLFIGILIAFREIMVNFMEVPSGAIADLTGRRRVMILGFAAYMVSFTVFGLTGMAALNGMLGQYALTSLLFSAMFFFAVGDAFRTGTHKAMIFMWLYNRGRIHERTKVYGYTRSWSKIGSAVSVVLACLFVFMTSNFIYVFFLAIIPYAIGIINFLGYPEELDCKTRERPSVFRMLGHLKETFLFSVKDSSLRRLIMESMGFEGFFKASKDYLQPVLKAASLPLTTFLFSGIPLTEEQRSVMLIGPVFFVLFVLSAVASRKSYLLVKGRDREDRAAHGLWGGSAVVFLCLFPAMYFGNYPLMITGFVVFYMMQNLWRPVLISRFYSHCHGNRAATVLSLESQAKSVSTMMIAPLLGLSFDLAGEFRIGVSEFWPMGLLGLVIASLFFFTGRKQGVLEDRGCGIQEPPS